MKPCLEFNDQYIDTCESQKKPALQWMMHHLAALSCLLFAACGKKDEGSFLQVCGMPVTGNNLLIVQEQHGSLAYTDTIPGVRLESADYFIFANNIQRVPAMPLHICGFPAENFPDLERGQSVDVIFNGKIALLPETVDALSLETEVTAIEAR